MLSREEANNRVLTHFGEGRRARHSVFVGDVMAHFARMLGEDRLLWEMPGLCYDLDFEATADDRSRHGLLAAEWLQNDLPNVALLAIQSHDYRTGISSNTTLAVALRLADAVAVGELDVGRDAMIVALSAASPLGRLEETLSARPSETDQLTGRSAFNFVASHCINLPGSYTTMTALGKGRKASQTAEMASIAVDRQCAPIRSFHDVGKSPKADIILARQG